MPPVPWNPEPYQLEAAGFLVDEPYVGLFLDPGLRKTSITLAALCALMREGQITRTLVVAPLRPAYLVWPREVEKWKEFSHLRVVVLHGLKKDRLLQKEADIYVINPEGLSWLFGVHKEVLVGRDGKERVTYVHDLKLRFDRLRIDALVVDEASRFKHPSSDRSKILAPVLCRFRRRYALTGSPVANGLMNIFGVQRVVDDGRAFGRYVTHFRSAFFDPTGFGGYDWKPKPGAEARIQELIAPTTYRLAGEDYLKLPELVDVVVEVNLPPEARRVYDGLERDMIALLDDGESVVARSAGSVTVKCRQVANGGIYLDRGVDDQGRLQGRREWRDVHSAKADAAAELVEELNGAPALVTYEFEHDLARLLKVFGRDTPYVGGSVSPRRTAQIVDAWNEGRIPVLLGQPTAVALGLNMQDGGAQHVVWHSLVYDYEMYDQLIRRFRRSGNRAAQVFNHLLIARDTVDEAMLLAIRRKATGQDRMLTALREYCLERRAKFKKKN